MIESFAWSPACVVCLQEWALWRKRMKQRVIHWQGKKGKPSMYWWQCDHSPGWRNGTSAVARCPGGVISSMSENPTGNPDMVRSQRLRGQVEVMLFNSMCLELYVWSPEMWSDFILWEDPPGDGQRLNSAMLKKAQGATAAGHSARKGDFSQCGLARGEQAVTCIEECWVPVTKQGVSHGDQREAGRWDGSRHLLQVKWRCF